MPHHNLYPLTNIIFALKFVTNNMFKNLLLFLFPTLILGQLDKDKLSALQAHNDARAEVGVTPLVWSDKLEEQALKYAKQIARTNNYKHSNTRDGENLAMFYEYEESNKVKTHIYSDTPFTMLQCHGMRRSKIISTQKLNVIALDRK
ncbi:MAG: hypothetical protein CM15mP32_6480 [Flavobacteriaceae bacterium]|nr:MAG: hypothetical protein CM15mP32_6480 [Flavobacteriaceae bacterium]